MPTEEKNSVQNEPPRIAGVIVFALVILGLIFFRGIYSLEVKSHSLDALIPPARADVPGEGGSEDGGEGGSEDGGEGGCEAEAEGGSEGGCEGEGEGGGE